jgi:hypothetical protein
MLRYRQIFAFWHTLDLCVPRPQSLRYRLAA